MKKTNAIRILEQKNIPFETLGYEFDSENLTVQKIAKANGLDESEIFKTLVIKGDKNRVVVAVIPGNKSLNFKSIAKISKNKKMTLLPVGDLLKTTGYIRGGCSPIGMKKEYPIYIDKIGEQLEQIFVNAGKRGLLIRVNINDLVKIVNGTFANIST